MRVVRPTELLREAAEVLAPVRDEVVVIGALAVQIALDGHDVALAVTRDLDAAVATEAVDNVVACLEARGLRRSELLHERAFTWVRGDLKVQLLRPFHPFPKGPAERLPVNNLIGMLADHRMLVAFEPAPTVGHLWAATPAALVVLKEAAFGRTRASGERVDRDFSDAAMLLDRLGETIIEEAAGWPQLRGSVVRAAERLQGADGLGAAARELVRSGHEETVPAAELAVQRATQRLLRRLAPDRG